MEISQTDFIFLLLYSLASGAVLGVIYDAIRISRALILPTSVRCGRDYSDIELPIIHKRAYVAERKRLSGAFDDIVTAIGDFTFMIVAAVTIILVAYVMNSGRVRWLIPFGVAVGFVIYSVTVGKLIMRISGLIVFLIRATIIYLWEILKFPVRVAFSKIKEYNIKKEKKIKDKNVKNEKGRSKWHKRKIKSPTELSVKDR